MNKLERYKEEKNQSIFDKFQIIWLGCGFSFSCVCISTGLRRLWLCFRALLVHFNIYLNKKFLEKIIYLNKTQETRAESEVRKGISPPLPLPPRNTYAHNGTHPRQRSLGELAKLPSTFAGATTLAADGLRVGSDLHHNSDWTVQEEGNKSKLFFVPFAIANKNEQL